MTAQNGLYYGAAATTAIAWILHLMLATSVLGFSIITGIILHCSWNCPNFLDSTNDKEIETLPWYLAGIGGTIVLIALWSITTMPSNPITGSARQVDEMGIAIEALQVAFIGLTAAIVAYETRRKRLNKKTASESVWGSSSRWTCQPPIFVRPSLSSSCCCFWLLMTN